MNEKKFKMNSLSLSIGRAINSTALVGEGAAKLGLGIKVKELKRGRPKGRRGSQRRGRKLHNSKWHDAQSSGQQADEQQTKKLTEPSAIVSH